MYVVKSTKQTARQTTLLLLKNVELPLCMSLLLRNVTGCGTAELTVQAPTVDVMARDATTSLLACGLQNLMIETYRCPHWHLCIDANLWQVFFQVTLCVELAGDKKQQTICR